MATKIYKISEERRKIMSDAQQKSSKEGRFYAKFWLGKTHSDETKKKISEAKKLNPTKYWLGKSRSEETKKKISDAHLLNPISYWLGKKRPDMSGPLSPMWVNGSSKSPRPQSRKAAYKHWRTAVLKRDGYQCLMPGCEDKDPRLEVNHIKTYAKYPELSESVGNGIALCRPCHRGIRTREEVYENLFFAIIKN